MVKRLQPDNLKLRSEVAKKKLSDDRRTEQNLKREQDEISKSLQALWESQRTKIINAAIEGADRVELDPPVIFYKKLIREGIDVVEEGLISGELMVKAWKKTCADDLSKIRDEVLAEFDKFIDAAKSDLKEYYGGVRRLHEFNYSSLIDAMETDGWGFGFRGDYFIGDEIFFNEVPQDLRENFQDYLDRINEKIKEYRNFIKNSGIKDEAEESDLRFNLDRSDSEYTYDLDDENADKLEPCEEGNMIFAYWLGESEQMCLHEPLLSREGLSWISSVHGQSLLQAINDSIEISSDLGRRKCILDFSLRDDGWFFKFNEKSVPSCLPEDVIDLIKQDGLAISCKPKKDAFSITVEW